MRRAILALQPVLAALIVSLGGLFRVVDDVFPASSLPFDLLLGVPFLVLSTLTYLYTVLFLAAFLTELWTLDVRGHSTAFLAAGVAVVVQAGYLVWPAYRVLGPATFEEVLFTSADFAVLVVAGLATTGYLYATAADD